jgi:hypothetical protein
MPGATTRAQEFGKVMDNPKVTIIGLLSQQANTIRSIYGDKLDLKFIEVDTSTIKMRATAETSDQVVLMTKFIPHEIQTALRKHDLVYCNGGVSSLKLILDAMPHL